MKLREGVVYRTRNCRNVVVKPNETGWLDGLPWCCHEIRVGMVTKYPTYTCTNEGKVWPDRTEDYFGEPYLFPLPVEDGWDIMAEETDEIYLQQELSQC